MLIILFQYMYLYMVKTGWLKQDMEERNLSRVWRFQEGQPEAVVL